MIPIPHFVSDQMILRPVCIQLHWRSTKPRLPTSRWTQHPETTGIMRNACAGFCGTGPTGTIAENSTVASGKGVRQYSRVSMTPSYKPHFEEVQRFSAFECRYILPKAYKAYTICCMTNQAF